MYKNSFLCFCAFLLCIYGEYLCFSFVIITMAIITIFVGGIDLKDYIYAMLLPLCFIMLSTITIAINFTSAPINEYSIRVLNFYINFGSRYRCIELLFRSMGAVSCLYGISMSTPIADIIQVLYSIKCPKLVVELMFLIYRFIFMLMDVLHNMTISATSRGGYDSYKNSYYTYSNIGKNLFLYALKKTNNSFDAMTSRGYIGDLNFYNENSKVKFKEIAGCVVYVLVLIGVSLCLR
ncbi:MAG: cobalt ECF transporter T component CbiQ [Lachnospirales bacterium]